MRLKIRTVLAAASALLLAAGCGAAEGSSGGDGTTLRIGIISPRNALYDPLGYLHAKGRLLELLKPAGVTGIKVLGFGKGPDLNQALLAGSLDVGILGDTPGIVAKAQDVDTRLIGQERVGMDAAIVVRKGGPTTVKGLAGKRVATTTGGYTHRYLRGLLNRYGVEAEIQNVAGPDQFAALRSGSVDAVATSLESALLIMEKGGFPVIDTSEKRPELQGNSITVATASYVKARPGFPKVWRAALDTAAKAAVADWDGYLAYYAEARGYSVEITRAASRKDQYTDAQLSPALLKGLEGTKQFLLSEKYIKEDVDLDAWVS
ncbi:ABC transporter substrate-binding protein [Actinomadura sp. GTD37]|uniref:ABC transporter substrate-binding protein n=1 Tax=Actinomadura sp. GTD37 TaxID=1778030 RepID=UPI0035C0C16F